MRARGAAGRGRGGREGCLPSLGPSNERDRCRAKVREGLSHGPLIKKRNRRPGRDATSVRLSVRPFFIVAADLVRVDFPLQENRRLHRGQEYRVSLVVACSACEDARTEGREGRRVRLFAQVFKARVISETKSARAVTRGVGDAGEGGRASGGKMPHNIFQRALSFSRLSWPRSVVHKSQKRLRGFNRSRGLRKQR